MLPTEDLFVYVYVLVQDLMLAGCIAVPPRPGPRPACSDGELLAIAVVRHLLGRRSESGFLAEVAREQCWGAFTGTSLHDFLQSRDVTQVVLAANAMTDTDPDAHRHSVEKIFPRLGETAATAGILATLGA
jgi:hypothetical protein